MYCQPFYTSGYHPYVSQSWFSLNDWIEYFKNIAYGALGTVAFCGLLTTAKGVDASFGTTVLQTIAKNAGAIYGYSC